MAPLLHELLRSYNKQCRDPANYYGVTLFEILITVYFLKQIFFEVAGKSLICFCLFGLY